MKITNGKKWCISVWLRIFFACLVVLSTNLLGQQVQWEKSWPLQGGGRCWQGIGPGNSEVFGWDTNGDNKIDKSRYTWPNGSVTETIDEDFDEKIDSLHSKSGNYQYWAYDKNKDGKLDHWQIDANGDNKYEEDRWYDSNGVLRLKKSIESGRTGSLYGWDKDHDGFWESYTYEYPIQGGKEMYGYQHKDSRPDPTSIAYGKNGIWTHEMRDMNNDGKLDSWYQIENGSSQVNTSPPSNVPQTSIPNEDSDDYCVKLKKQVDGARDALVISLGGGDSEKLQKKYDRLWKIYNDKCKRAAWREMNENR